MPAQTIIKLRRSTAAQWASANPVLGAGEPGLETDTNKVKFGDGVSAWGSLSYFGVLSSIDDIAGVSIASVTTGQVLQWNGSEWVNADIVALPDQAGNGGKYLTTDGFEARWEVLDIPPGTQVSETAPTSPEEGQMWWNSATGVLYVYYDQFWVEAVTGATGPQGPQGVQGPAGPQGAPGDAAFHPFLVAG